MQLTYHVIYSNQFKQCNYLHNIKDSLSYNTVNAYMINT